MSQYSKQELEQALCSLVESGLPEHPVADVTQALQVAGLLEGKGYSFTMRDLCPNSLCDSNWRAVFTKNDREYVSEDPDSATAICGAALCALQGQ